MMNPFLRPLVSAALALAPVCSLSDFEAKLLRHEWPQPVSAEPVLAISQLRDAANAFNEYPNGRLTIRHPGGEAGSVWGMEVRDMLISLGIPSLRISLDFPSPEPNAVFVVVAEEPY